MPRPASLEPATARPTGPGSTTAGAAAAGDVVVVLVFTAIGRRSHAESGAVAAVLATAWPFLAGTAAAWVGVPAARRAPLSAATGMIAGVGTVAVGMAARRVVGAGTPPAFVAVATGFLLAGMLGWRGAAALVRRRRVRRV